MINWLKCLFNLHKLKIKYHVDDQHYYMDYLCENCGCEIKTKENKVKKLEKKYFKPIRLTNTFFLFKVK